MSESDLAQPRACDPPSTTALTPLIAPSRLASDMISSRCGGESCFTLEPPS